MTGLLASALGWLAASGIGWGLGRLTLSLIPGGAGRYAAFFAGLAVALGVGATITGRLWKTRRPSVWSQAGLVAAVGWGIAAAVGWSFDVRAGGPLSGMATAMALRATRLPRPRWGQLIAIAGAATLVMVAAMRLPGFGLLWTRAGYALIAGSVIWWLGARWLDRPPVGSGDLVLLWGWGLAWTLGFWLSGRVPLPRPYGPASLEIGLAFVLGGIITAFLAPRLSAGSAGRGPAIGAWVLGGIVATGLGAGLDTVLVMVSNQAGRAATAESFLVFGHVVSMGLGGWLGTARSIGRAR